MRVVGSVAQELCLLLCDGDFPVLVFVVALGGCVQHFRVSCLGD